MIRQLAASAFVLGLMAATLHAAEKITTPVEKFGATTIPPPASATTCRSAGS